MLVRHHRKAGGLMSWATYQTSIDLPIHLSGWQCSWIQPGAQGESYSVAPVNSTHFRDGRFYI